MKLAMYQKIIFVGDSITDCDRREPTHAPYGNGYVYFIANLLFAQYRNLNLQIVNKGISGDTVRTLKPRWNRDVIAQQPDVLSILIGANDVWRRHRGPERLPDAVFPEEYEQTYAQLLTDVTKNTRCKFIVLIEPFIFCSNHNNNMYKDLQEYIQIVRTLAARFNAIHIPLQYLINLRLSDIDAGIWSPDMVHPYTWAHAWIAQQWLCAADISI
jgi:lysophospholipase L1-like esterase